MAYELKDFKDIQDFVMEELKYQSGDTTSRNRIKRDINAVYLNEVVPKKRWFWLNGHTSVKHEAYYYAGTASVTPDSAAVTLSTAPSDSKLNDLFAVDGFSEIYSISAHTAATTAVTLDSEYQGTLAATANFKIWNDTIALPVDCRETVEVFHNFSNRPLKPVGLQEFRRLVASNPRQVGRPEYYCVYDFFDPSSGDAETEVDRYRVMKVWPSVSEYTTTIQVDYVKDVTALDLDGDEPLMPISDRIVLAYGALARAWKRERNPTAAQDNEGYFGGKLSEMMGRHEDSRDTPQFVPQSRYVLSKRRGRSQRAGDSPTSGTSHSAPSFLKGVTIEGANITDDVTVTASVTIDGRDISADGATLDTLTGTIGNIDTANRAVITDTSGNLEESDVTSDEILFLDDVEKLASVTLADNTSSPTAALQWDYSNYDSILLQYTLKRGSGNQKTGFLLMTSDGTNTAVAGIGAAQLGTLGVTFTGDVSGSNARLLYTTTSTGTAVTMKYKVHKWLG